jgi:hypothetical protein
VTAPHPHTKPAAHPHLETTVAVLALIVGAVIEAVTAVAGWVADLTEWDRVRAVVRTVLLVILAVVTVAVLAACRPRDTRPGPIEQDTATAIHTSAVKVVQP